MSEIAKLTVSRISALVPQAREFVIFEAATPGFGVRVYPSGERRFVFRYRAGHSRGAPTRMETIGDVRKIGVDDARRHARDLAGRVARGADPAAERRAAAVERRKEETTFATVRADFLAKHVDPKLRQSSADEYRRVLKKEFAGLDGRPIASVTRADIATVLDGIAGRGKLRTANLARAYVRKMLAWACASGLCEVNVATDTARAGPDVRRDRVLSRDELGDIYNAALQAKSAFGRAVRFLMLTGQRRSEVFEMPLAEADEAARLWSLPGDRTKNRRSHEVPLSATALRVLAARPQGGVFAFGTASDRPLAYADKSKRSLQQRVDELRKKRDANAVPMPGWTIHDLRRSFVTHAAEDLGTPVAVIERAINHVSGTFGGVVGTYNRAPLMKERVVLFDAWEAWVLGPPI